MRGRLDKEGKEVVDVTQYRILVETPSRFVKGMMVEKEIGIRCPRCSAACRNLDHSESTKCGYCGLRMQLYGIGLHLWEG